MTAAFVAFSSLFFLPLSALPGQDAPAQTTLEEYARGVFSELDGAPASARLHFETALARDSHSFVLAKKAAALQEQTGDRPAASLLNRASRNRRTTGADSAEVSGTYLKVVLRPLLDIARSTFDFFSPKECLSSPK